MKPDKQIERGDHKYQFTDKVACCKWFDRQSLTMQFSDISGMPPTSTVQLWMKGSAAKIPAPCPDLIKMHSQGMGGIELVHQRTAAYYLDRKSSITFNPCIFFDLMDVA